MAHGICRILQMQHVWTSTFHFAWRISIVVNIFEALWNLNLLTSSFTSWSLHTNAKKPKRAKTKAPNNKIRTAEGGHGGRHSACPQETQRQLRLCSAFAIVVVLVSIAVLVASVACVVLSAPFVVAALVVCAAGAVLHVVVAKLVIKQNNKEASRKRKSNESRKNTKQRTKSRESKNIKTEKQKKQRSKNNREA